MFHNFQIINKRNFKFDSAQNVSFKNKSNFGRRLVLCDLFLFSGFQSLLHFEQIFFQRIFHLCFIHNMFYPFLPPHNAFINVLKLLLPQNGFLFELLFFVVVCFTYLFTSTTSFKTNYILLTLLMKLNPRKWRARGITFPRML